VFVLLIKGGNHYNSIIGLTECGFVGNLVVGVHFCLSFLCAREMGKKIIEKDEKKVVLGFVFQYESDKMS
jgi:hypothetical protein